MKVNYRPVLIVRSVSIEKISVVIDLCQHKWPGNPVYIVTAGAGRKHECLADSRVCEVLVHNSLDGAYAGRFESVLNFEAIVFPVENGSGVGYANIFKCFSFVNTQGYYLSEFCSNLKTMSKLRLKLKVSWELFVKKMAGPFASLLAKIILKRVIVD